MGFSDFQGDSVIGMPGLDYLNDPETVLGEEGREKLHQLSDFSYSFEKIIKILVDRVEGLNGKLDRLAEHCYHEIKETNRKVDTLAHNIQGFDDNSEKLAVEKDAMEAYRAKVMHKQKEINIMLAAKMKHVAARKVKAMEKPPEKKMIKVKKQKDKVLKVSTPKAASPRDDDIAAPVDGPPKPKVEEVVDSPRGDEPPEAENPAKADAPEPREEKKPDDAPRAAAPKPEAPTPEAPKPEAPTRDEPAPAAKAEEPVAVPVADPVEDDGDSESEYEYVEEPGPEFGYRSDGSPRNPDAMRKWHWALHQIKFRNFMNRLDLKGVKVQMRASIARRLEAAEQALDNLVFRLGTKGGADGDQGLKDELRVLNRRYEQVREQVEAIEADNKETEVWKINQDAKVDALEVIADETKAHIEEVHKKEKVAEDRKHSKEGVLVDAIAKLRELAYDARHATDAPRVRASPTCAYLDDFWKELLGDSHPGTDEHAPEFGSGLFDMEDKREGAPGNTRALALERLAWACHRLLTLNEKGVDRSKDDFEFGRSFVPLKSVMKRGGAYGFFEGVKTQYDALLALLEESVNAGEVKMRTRWLAKEVAEIPPPKNADTAMLLELNDRVEVVAELGEEALRMAAEGVTHEEMEARFNGVTAAPRREASMRATQLLEQSAMASQRSSLAFMAQQTREAEEREEQERLAWEAEQEEERIRILEENNMLDSRSPPRSDGAESGEPSRDPSVRSAPPPPLAPEPDPPEGYEEHSETPEAVAYRKSLHEAREAQAAQAAATASTGDHDSLASSTPSAAASSVHRRPSVGERPPALAASQSLPEQSFRGTPSSTPASSGRDLGAARKPSAGLMARKPSFAAGSGRALSRDSRDSDAGVATPGGRKKSFAGMPAYGGGGAYGGPPGASKDELDRLDKRFEEVRALLEATRDELGAKLEAADLKEALSVVNKQLARITSTKLNKSDLDEVLAQKVDRKDIDRIAAQLAGEEEDNSDPVLAAKLQVPKFRCMSCDRPLRHPPRCEAGKAQQSPAAFEDLGPAAAAVPPVDITNPFAQTTTIRSLGKGASADEAIANSAVRPKTVEGAPLLQPPPGAPASLTSRYPPLVPPPERIRTAVGGGAAGLQQMMITRKQRR